MEWYWNKPGVAHVAEFVEAVKKRTGRVPTARTWFGYVAVWTCALAARAKAKSLKAVDMAKALQDYHLPPEIALGAEPGLLIALAKPTPGLAVRRRSAGARFGAGRSLQGDLGRERR